MTPRTLSTALGALLMAGCARQAVIPPLAADHPASPMAAEAPPPPRSQTLALSNAALPALPEG